MEGFVAVVVGEGEHSFSSSYLVHCSVSHVLSFRNAISWVSGLDAKLGMRAGCEIVRKQRGSRGRALERGDELR